MAQSILSRSSIFNPLRLPHQTSAKNSAQPISQRAARSSPLRAMIGDFSQTHAPGPSVVPRIAHLVDYRESSTGEALARPESLAVRVVEDGKGKQLADLLMATVEVKAQVEDFETLVGRGAMVLFTIALSVEFLTGNGIFSNLDATSLLPVASLGAVATVAAGAYAFAWRSKRHVSDILSRGCVHWMDAAVDQVIDGVFFPEGRAAHQAPVRVHSSHRSDQ